MKPKEWLKENGFITEIKQGRLSAENKAHIQKAVDADSSLFIEGYSASTSANAANKADNASNADTPSGAVSASADKAKDGPTFKNMDIPNTTRDEGYFNAFALVEGKKIAIGMRDVCAVCNSSFTYCHCKNAYYYVPGQDDASMVIFAPKK